MALIGKMADGPAWKKTLETRGWDGIYLAGDKFAEFVKKDITDTTAILKGLGLAT